MNDTTKDVAATLLLPVRKGKSFLTEVIVTLNEQLCELGHVVHNISTSGKHLARFDIEGAQIVVAYCGAPVTPAKYRLYLRPDACDSVSDAEAAARVKEHRACVIVSARPHDLPGYVTPSMDQIEDLMHHLITYVCEKVRVRLVLWGQTGILYTEDEFADIVALSDACRPANPVRTQADGTDDVWFGEAYPALIAAQNSYTPENAENSDPGKRGLFAQNVMDIRSLHERLDGSLAERRRLRPKGSDAGAPTTDKTQQPVTPLPEDITAPANDLPDMPMPKFSEATRIRRALYPEDLSATISPRDMPLVHRISIYTLNTTLLVVAFPVGAGMLVFNAAGRENLTATARAMAITGVGIFYSQLPFVQELWTLL